MDISTKNSNPDKSEQWGTRRSFPYMYFKFGVTESWESSETENAIHFEPHTFHIFRILAYITALVSAWFKMKFMS